MDKLLYTKLSNERNPKLNIRTDIVERDGVRLVKKMAVDEASTDHIRHVFHCYEGLCSAMKNSCFTVNKSSLVEDVIESEYLQGRHLTIEDSKKYALAVTETYMRYAKDFEMSPEFEAVFGQVNLPPNTKAARYVDIDLIFDNIIETQDGSWQIIDYEWTFDFYVPINYILWRAEKYCGLDIEYVNISVEEREAYQSMEYHLQYNYIFSGVYNIHELEKHVAEVASDDATSLIISSKDYRIKQLQKTIEDKDRHISNIEAINALQAAELENMRSSFCWRITKPIRVVSNVFRGNGQEPEPKAKAAEVSNTLEVQVSKTKEAKKTSKKNKKNKPTVAVHIHLYYTDLLAEFVSYLENIPFKFDLYISIGRDADVDAIKSGCKSLKRVGKLEVKSVENRGRDLAPLYCIFAREILEHDYFLHAHSKKSIYSGVEKAGWRQYSMETLMGSPTTVEAVMNMFEQDNAGLIYPDFNDELPMIAYSWLKNEARGRKLFKEFDISRPFPSVFNYPAGSFFWARTQALKPLFDRMYSLDDFEVELGQTDGTLAHALERILPFISAKQGFDDYILAPLENDKIRKNHSNLAFKNYFKLDKQSLIMQLSEYDIISFDIFDTLCTRGVMEPDDVFDLMSEAIFEKYGKKVDFKTIRKRAEEEAVAENGAFTNINHIYGKIGKDKTVGEYATPLKNMEIDIEHKLCIPRKDMVEVYSSLKSMGKTVILVSDMYLTKPHIAAMLHKCGVSYYDDLILSCEVGARKDDDSIWDLIFEHYPSDGFIHVGDNFTSDSQILMDRGFNSQIVLNTKALLELSEYRDLMNYTLASDYTRSMRVANSLMLGHALNGGLFNSPFAFDTDGKLVFKDINTLGHTTMAPLMTYFTQWLSVKVKPEEKLLLLAREGVLLEKLIDKYYGACKKSINDHVYFLTSRRAASLAAVADDQDIEHIAMQYYQGSFSNLLMERFGLELHTDEEDFDIVEPHENSWLMERLIPYIDEIKTAVAREKEAYLSYVNNLVQKDDKLAVVDVGFSGTIQYFLTGLLGRKLGGYYVATYNFKPKAYGQAYDSIYDIKSAEEYDASKLMNYQLFLENALSATTGQLTCFEKKENDIVPCFKEADEVPSSVRDMQQAMITYAEQMGTVYRVLPKTCLASPKLAESLFHDIIAGGAMTQDMADDFSVEDKYSAAGFQRFDVASGSWKIN